MWLGELYRLVTTYNILGKAGYTAESLQTNGALINSLNDNMLSDGEDSPFLHHRNPSALPPGKREGMKFARRVLLTSWDSVLEILSVPLETSTLGWFACVFPHRFYSNFKVLSRIAPNLKIYYFSEFSLV